MVTLAKIGQCLQIDRKLKPLTSIKGMDKKVADRVRSLQAKAVPVQPETNPKPSEWEREGDPFAFVDEESSNREPNTARLAWDARDSKIVTDRFLKECKYPGIWKTVAIFHETANLTRIFNENGKARCIENS